VPTSKELIAKRILETVRQVIPLGHGPVALHEPEFRGNEWNYLKECIDTGWVSSVGKFVNRFEHMLSDYTGAAHAIATVNGTATLHVALLLAGVQPDDEVLIPALTFIATANAVAYCGATPHFVDSAYDSLGLGPKALDEYLKSISEPKDNSLINRVTGKTIRAVVPMHTFGHPVDMDGLCEVCQKYSLTIVEDAAESLGSTYHGKHTGRFGRISALSFNGNKIVTTGGGGAILTDDPELARRGKHITTTARIPNRWAISHDEIGFNYRMPNLNAALGCAQLEALPEFLSRKRRLAERYEEAFDGIEDATFVSEPVGTRSNYWLNSILLSEDVAHTREDVLECLNDEGIMARPCWTLMHRLPMYQNCPRAPLPVAEDIERRLINLPSSANLA
jgi:perosamine synthetase